MATTSIRWDVVEKVVSLLEAHTDLAGVGIHYAWPGDLAVTPEMVWVGEITGDLDIPVSRGPRFERDDEFSFPLHIRVFSQLGPIKTVGARLHEIMGAIGDILAIEADLEDLDGVVDARITDEVSDRIATTEGIAGYGMVTISVHSRLH